MTRIGNDPYLYDNDDQTGLPHVRRRSRRRGRNAVLIGTAFLVGAIGLIVFQKWLGSWGWHAEKAIAEIRPAHAEIPNYKIPDPPKADVPAPPQPPPVAPEPVKATPRAAPARKAELPTQIAWSVQPQGEPDGSWFTDGRRPKLAHGCALRPGASQIHGVTETVINSEVPGQVIATVSENVPDADGVGRTLIPQGTRVVGYYKTGGRGLSFNSRRLGIVWTELAMPDGTQLNLDQSNGMDAAGSMGMGGTVETQWGNLIATAALLTVFDGLQRSATPEDNSLSSNMSASASNNVSRLGREVTQQVFQWEPRIIIPAGTPVVISPNKTIQVCSS